MLRKVYVTMRNSTIFVRTNRVDNKIENHFQNMFARIIDAIPCIHQQSREHSKIKMIFLSNFF